MTIEAYIASVLEKHPEFVAEMNEHVAAEYGEQIKTTQEDFAKRLAAAKAAWEAKGCGEEFAAKEEEIKEHIAFTIPRRCYIKRVPLEKEEFDVAVDLLTGEWRISPV